MLLTFFRNMKKHCVYFLYHFVCHVFDDCIEVKIKCSSDIIIYFSAKCCFDELCMEKIEECVMKLKRLLYLISSSHEGTSNVMNYVSKYSFTFSHKSDLDDIHDVFHSINKCDGIHSIQVFNYIMDVIKTEQKFTLAHSSIFSEMESALSTCVKYYRCYE